MRAKACKHCGRTFVPASKYTYLCPECHANAKSSGVVQDRQCRQCGAVFPGGPRAWYCPNCRKDRQREQQRKHDRNGSARLLGSTDLCIRCGSAYTVASGRQKYCPACAAVAVSETVRAHKRQYAAERSAQIAEYKAEMSSNRHVCIVCGSVYDSDVPNVTCSQACAKIRRQQIQREADAKRLPRKKEKKHD